MNTYFIKQNYNQRLTNSFFDDTEFKDEWQKEVYLYAKNIAKKNNYSFILDFGCGSAYKLISNFTEYKTIGIDLPPTVEFLKNKYPDKTWLTTHDDLDNVDVFIASDVIEHMEDPDILIDYIKKCNPKEIILSTPDKNLKVSNWGEPEDGPPPNPSHLREWNYTEFKNYISFHFDIVHHEISNHAQCTQLIHARIK